MRYELRRYTLAIAVAGTAVAFPATAQAAPTVYWGTFSTPMSGNYNNSSGCQVDGTDIAKVSFFLDTTSLNTARSSPWQCKLDTRKFSDGDHTLKAVAYDSKGATTTITRTVTIQNGTLTSNTPPSVALLAPAAGAMLSGTISGSGCEASAADSDGIAKVEFYVGETLVTADGVSPYNCSIDTTAFSNGTHTVMAVATDTKGLAASTQRSVTISNGTASEPTTPATNGSTIDAADILTWASGNVSFSEQTGYTAQVVGTYTSASSISEGGIHYTVLPNGETLRLGKETDPSNSAKNALSFQLGPNDPNTSGNKRSELSFAKNVELDKIYWVAFKVYVRDWGNESSAGLFGTQMHSGNNTLGLSPSFGLQFNSARTFRIETRWSTSTSPTPSNSQYIKHGDFPIPFERWADIVIKFKHNTSGAGFLQAWMDGQLLVDYKGSLGFNTPGYKDYAKFGIYNWGSFTVPRKVMLHNPTVVADPTGSKYSAADLRAHVNNDGH